MISNKRNLFLSLVVALSALLASCDGGLFGTGDGHNANMMIDGTVGSGENPEGMTGGTTGGTTGATTGGATTGDNTISELDTQHSLGAFDNMQPGGQSSVPQLRVLNLTNVDIQVAVNDTSDLLINNLSGDQNSGRIDLPVDATSLLFSNTSIAGAISPVVIHTIDPFNAAEFTITTAIVRRKLDDSIGVIALTTQAESTSPSTALVRLVQTSTLGDASRSDTITLMAVEPNNSGSEVSFETLSFDSVSTPYADVIPGSYSLSDSANRFESENIAIEAGRVYTLVINSKTAPVLRVIEDSQ